MTTARREIITWLGVGSVAWGGGFFWQYVHAPSAAWCWLSLSGGGMAYLTFYTWQHLGENRPTPEAPLYPTLGPANTLTLLRGVAVALMLGFFCPHIAAGWGPGLLYTYVALSDWWDGLLARLSGRPSLLGQRLDMLVDGVGVLAASALAVALGRLPWWYLSVGLARYAFLGWEALLSARGRAPRSLSPDPQRRANAGLMMGFLAVALWPLFSSRALALVGIWFLILFLALFLRDAAWEAGLDAFLFLPAVGAGKPYRGGPRAAFRWLATLAFLVALQHPGAASPIRWGGSVLVALLALGILPRLAALGGLFALGIAWTAGFPQGGVGVLAAAALTAVAFYGGGAACLWAPEDRIFLAHVGAPAPTTPVRATD